MLHVAADSAQPFVDALHRLPAHACRRTPGGHWWVTPTHRPTLILLVHGFDHAWLIEGDQQTDLKTGRRS